MGVEKDNQKMTSIEEYLKKLLKLEQSKRDEVVAIVEKINKVIEYVKVEANNEMKQAVARRDTEKMIRIKNLIKQSSELQSALQEILEDKLEKTTLTSKSNKKTVDGNQSRENKLTNDLNKRKLPAGVSSTRDPRYIANKIKR